MKKASLTVTAAAAAVSAAATVPWTSGPQGRTCPCEYDAQVDYFPTKLAPDESAHWTVEYHKSYKVMTNTKLNKTFVGYLCGTPAPSGADVPEGATLVSLPVERVGVTSSTSIPYLELLTQRQSIAYYDSDPAWVSSECFQQHVTSGHVADGKDDPTKLKALNASLDVVFCDAFSCSSLETAFADHENAPALVPLSDTEEGDAMAVLETVEFVALFFNREVVASNILELVKTRYDCNKGEATSQPTQPKVLWISPSWNNPGVFDVADCPNFYCQLAEDAGATLIDHTQFAESRPNAWASGYEITLDTLLAYDLGSVDVVVYANSWQYRNTTEWDVILAEMTKVTANDNVFDIYKSSHWFERRNVQPDLLLLDLISAAHPVLVPNHDRVFLRRAVGDDDEGPAAAGAECADVSAPLSGGWVDLTCVELKSGTSKGSLITPEGSEVSDGTIASGEDSAEWVSSTGAGCETYTPGGVNHANCFSDRGAAVNCPYACQLCDSEARPIDNLDLDGQYSGASSPISAPAVLVAAASLLVL